jgi:hypothetical protein
VTKNVVHRIDFAGGTLGCLTTLVLFFAIVIFWLVGFADLSDSTLRGPQLFSLIQSIRIGSFPLGAAILAGYFVFEGGKNGWRWADKTALTINGDHISIHPSYLKKSISLDSVTSVTMTHRTSTWVKSINPALVIRWQDGAGMPDRRMTIRNLNLESSEGHTAIEFLKAVGKWLDE